MTITVDLTPELEQQIRTMAAQMGMAPDMYIAEIMREQFKLTVASSAPQASARETQLLLLINRSLSGIDWSRYHDLITKQQEHSLQPHEHKELISLTDAIEQANVERIAAAVELAQLRHTSLETILRTLGLNKTSHT